jgi:hypothetical protein
MCGNLPAAFRGFPLRCGVSLAVRFKAEPYEVAQEVREGKRPVRPGCVLVNVLNFQSKKSREADADTDLFFFFHGSILRLLKGIRGQVPGRFPGLCIDGGFFVGRFLWFLIAGTD